MATFSWLPDKRPCTPYGPVRWIGQPTKSRGNIGAESILTPITGLPGIAMSTAIVLEHVNAISRHATESS